MYNFSMFLPFSHPPNCAMPSPTPPSNWNSQNSILPCQDPYFVGGQSYNCPYSTTTSESSVDVSKETWVSFWAASLLDNAEPQQAPQTQGKFYSSALLVEWVFSQSRDCNHQGLGFNRESDIIENLSKHWDPWNFFLAVNSLFCTSQLRKMKPYFLCARWRVFPIFCNSWRLPAHKKLLV